MNEFLTIKEISEMMKVSRQTIYRWFELGLKYYKFEKAVRVKKADLESFVEKRRRG